jgi:cytochrome c556
MLAFAEVLPHYAPARPKGGKGAKEWKQYNDDWRKGTRELLDALKKADPSPMDVKKAANNINNACNSCHSDFRDS